MAYPSRLPATGALSLADDVFEYFKGALLAYDTGGFENQNDNTEKWPAKWFDFDLYTSIFQNAPSLPFDRGDFRDWIDSWTITPTSPITAATWYNYRNHFKTIGGTPLYDFSEPAVSTDWPGLAINHWGKIKSMELSLFGSTESGGSGGSDVTLFGSGTLKDSIPGWSLHSQSLLRCALSRFSSYSSCNPEIVRAPGLFCTYNTINDYVSITIPTGYSLSDIGVSTDYGYTWANVSSNPWPVPIGESFPADSSKLRFKIMGSKNGYVSEGIYNTNPVLM